MEKQMNEMWGEQTAALSALADKAAFFKSAKFAMFVHWGLYSQAGGQWQGKSHHGIAEWMMNRLKISAKEYAALAREFDPADFDAEDFVGVAKAAGMKYIIITAKHHEGFAMFRSQDPFNAFDGTPFHRDPMAELAQECRKQGLGLGFYYSQFQDWQAYNRWDETLKNRDFDHYFRTKCLPQLRELMTQYGPLTLLWFDTPGEMTQEQSQEIVDLIRELQPQALVNSRIGNGVGDYVSKNDNEVPSQKCGGLWECIRTSNGSWGYSQWDTDFCSAREILWDLIQVVARGGTFMVNVGPDRSGCIPQPCRQALLETGKWMQKYGAKAIYSAEASCWDSERPWGDCTRKGNTAYFIIKDYYPGKVLTEYDFPGKVREVRCAGSGKKVPYSFKDGILKITLPGDDRKDLFRVFEVVCEEVIPDAANSLPVVNSDFACRLGAEHARLEKLEFKHDFWAERFGEFIYVNIIHNWQPAGKAHWDFFVDEPGFYRVSIRYQNVDRENRVWQLLCSNGESHTRWLPDAQSLPATPGQTEPVARFHTVPFGVLHWEKTGRFTLTLQSLTPDKESKLQVSELILEKF